MADIRINALATTAASTASDDFIAVDGSANGTRKLNAFSPTFGGNLTVNGTGTQTLNGKLDVITAASSAANVDLAVLRQNYAGTAGHEGLISFTNISGTSVGKIGTRAVDGNNTSLVLRNFVSGSLADALTLSPSVATLAGNLTVSGTGTSTFNGILNVSGSTNYLKISRTGTPTSGAAALQLSFNGTNSRAIRLTNVDTGGRTYDIIAGGGGDAASFGLYDDTSGAYRLFIPSTGNLLIGTTTDSGNGKLQLATHTTSAGGIGFGTDVSLYRQDANTLVVQPTGSSKKVLFYGDSTVSGLFNSLSSYEAIYFDPSTHSIKLATNGFTALTLDTSQNATFAGTVTGTQFKSASGTTSAADGVATTVLSLSGKSGQMYLVHASLSGVNDAGNYAAFATVVMDGTSARIVSNNGTYMTLTLSGTNVQATQTSGVTQTIVYKYTSV